MNLRPPNRALFDYMDLILDFESTRQFSLPNPNEAKRVCVCVCRIPGSERGGVRG